MCRGMVLVTLEVGGLFGECRCEKLWQNIWVPRTALKTQIERVVKG